MNHLKKAKQVKNDEFYTYIGDIANEIKYYKEQFKNKIIFLNCDNPEKSNFWKYFKNNFDKLQLKKLIATYYEHIDNELKLNIENGKFIVETPQERKEVYKWEFSNNQITKTKLKSNGDFRNKEIIDILVNEADIVVSNPPFSLFREYMRQLITYNKKFLIIGPLFASCYKGIFEFAKKNEIRSGINNVKSFFNKNGIEKKFGNIIWFTNLDNSKYKRNFLKLEEKYAENKYEFFNLKGENIININKLKNIPIDYNKKMAVPMTLFQYNNYYNEFEILGSIKPIINNKQIFQRLIIQKNNNKSLNQ